MYYAFMPRPVKSAPPPGATERDLAAHVSRRIRELRRAAGLSLDHLAARASVSKGVLVQIEKGDANPSIATLCKVAASLGASVADLVHLEAPTPAPVLAGGPPRVLWRGPKGGSATFLVGSSGPDMIELWSWHLRPGERYEGAAHPEGTQELVHVTEGTLALAFGPRQSAVPARAVHLVTTGESASARTDCPHSYACAGRSSVRFLMVVAEWHGPRAAGLGATRRRRAS
jgi:DNA-binding XRE family transcriptional regulator